MISSTETNLKSGTNSARSAINFLCVPLLVFGSRPTIKYN